MTAKEYLKQAYRLDQKIDSDIREKERLWDMSVSVSSPPLGDRIQVSQPSDAPFARTLEKVMTMEEQIDREIDLLVDLKNEIRMVISEVPDPDEQLVLKYRYIHNMTWEQIGSELSADRTTVYRWHGKALKHVKLPRNPIRI